MHDRIQEELFRAMENPRFYPHDVRAIERKETHISMVFLTGDRVYKIKKPVDFGFVDFTSLEKRRWYCHREVELNRRLSDGVYLEVASITETGDGFKLGGSGKPVEYAVVMRQLPNDRVLASLLSRHEIGEGHILALAERLVRFYEEQGGCDSALAREAYQNVSDACEENFRHIEWAAGPVLDPGRFNAIRKATRDFLSRRRPLFEQRIQTGMIRNAHGDLRTSHVYFIGAQEIHIVDCIEFNERLRHIDVASDLAFLSMELDSEKAPHLGAALIENYARASGDWQAFAVLPFFKCYRAMVRCKVNCIQIDSGEEPDRQKLFRANAERFLELAGRYADHMSRPCLWVVCGLPASGKSTISSELARSLDIAAFHSDRVRKALFGVEPHVSAGDTFESGIYTAEATRMTYDRLFHLAGQEMERGRSAVMDATFSRREQRRRAAALAQSGGWKVRIVECGAPDELLRRRLRGREHKRSVSDARLKHFEIFKRQFEALDTEERAIGLKVDTSRPLAENVGRVLTWDALIPVGDRAG
ncbi:MAG: AAA family ATPase [Desulfobacterales bacterium]